MYQYLAFFICYSILCFPITGLKGGLLTFTFYMIWLGWLCECKLSNKVTLSILFVFSFNYSNSLEEKGELIIGDLPHAYDSKNFEEKI